MGKYDYISMLIKAYPIINEPMVCLAMMGVDWVWANERDAAFSPFKNPLAENIDSPLCIFKVNIAINLLIICA